MTIEFDSLVLGSQMGQNKSGDHALWQAAVMLEQWYMLGVGEGDDLSPMFAKHEGKTHLLAFTEEERAEAMAEETEKQTGMPAAILHMEVPDAIEYLRALDEDGQVAGVHFNNGMFAFGDSLVNIIEAYKKYCE